MNFILRKATIKDIRNVFELSNQDYVRQYSFSPKKIDWVTHCKWFLLTIINPNIIFYILETNEKEYIGQIRLQCNEKFFWEISISLLKQFHNQHIASNALKQIIEQYNSLNFIATVKEDNISSIYLFESLNFQKSQTTIINNNIFYTYYLFRN